MSAHDDDANVFDMASLLNVLRTASAEQKDTLMVALGAAPASQVADPTQLTLPDAVSPFLRYQLFLRQAKDRHFSVVDRDEEFARLTACVPGSEDRAAFHKLAVYHRDLAAAYTDAVAVACLLEPSVDHSNLSATALPVLAWVAAYNKAHPNAKPPSARRRGRRGRGRNAPEPADPSTPRRAPSKPRKPRLSGMPSTGKKK